MVASTMTDKFRIGVAGLSHGHVGGLIGNLEREDSVQLVAVAEAQDIAPQLKAKFDRQYHDYQTMIKDEQLDGLLVTSNNKESAQIAIEALNAGIPTMVEKPMAANGADADRMRAAWRASGKPLLINWQFVWDPWLADLGTRVNEGEIGQVFHLKCRNGHFGPKEIGCESYFVDWLYNEELNGGGAIADFGGYGALLATWLLGMPETVYAIRGNQTKEYEISDDHAMILMRYPKATAVIEATWATVNFGAYPVASVFGDKGTLTEERQQVRKITRDTDEIIIPDTLAPANAAQGFLQAIETGITPPGLLHPDLNADACHIIDAAIRSDRSGRAEIPAASL